MATAFLTAEWRYLAMLNFVADSQLLKPLVPPGTELDFHGGETFVSVVGFLFLDTRLVGLPIPFHRNFEELNLRFYVRRNAPDGCRRGVAFVRELVPRRAIALVARAFYDEPYYAMPMRHAIATEGETLAVRYQWKPRNAWETLAMSARGQPRDLAAGSHEEFIAEHYWGYTARRRGTAEYAVEHPRWRFWPAETWKFEADVAALYGDRFVATLAAKPASAFIAEGSRVLVKPRSVRLR